MTKTYPRHPLGNIRNLAIQIQDLDLDRMKKILTDPTPDFEDLDDVEEELYAFADELEYLLDNIRKYIWEDLQTLKGNAN